MDYLGILGLFISITIRPDTGLAPLAVDCGTAVSSAFETSLNFLIDYTFTLIKTSIRSRSTFSSSRITKSQIIFNVSEVGM